ncbi:MAG: hypothetical protein JNM83_08090 [Myxococcales bacterium]|nr:hypothetical protein [Myxococcales bacterium]
MFKQIFAGRNGTIYAINQNGDLLWFRHLGFSDGTNAWESTTGITVGNGWGGFKKVLASNNGVIYAIAPDGKLYWYKHLGHETGVASWGGSGSGELIGGDWGSALHVLAADDGVLYSVSPNGDLHWVRHTGFDSGAATWSERTQVGTGWAVFTAIEVSSDGVLYGRTPSGELRWYKHLGYQTGTASWSGPVQASPANWNARRFVVSNSGVIYGINQLGVLSYYRHIDFNNGSNAWQTVDGLRNGFGNLVSLRASNGQYVCAEGGGGQAVVAHRNAAGVWETFNVIYLDQSRVALQTYNGMYVCAEGGGGQALVANRSAIGGWETFTLLDRGDGQVALQAYDGQYVCAEGGGGQALIANRAAIGPWETFALSPGKVDGNFAPIQGSLKHVSVGADGTVWGVNASDQIFRRSGDTWEHIPGALKQVSVGSVSQVFGVNSSDMIYRWLGGGWEQIPGSLKHVSVGADGTVWGVNSSDMIYRWLGGGWEQIPGSLKYVSVASDGTVFGISAANQVYRRSNGDWILVPGTLKQISVGSANLVFGVTLSDQIVTLSADAAAPIPGAPVFKDPGTTTPTPASGNATWDEAIAAWFAGGIEFLESNVKIRWVGTVSIEKSQSNVVYRGRMEFSAPLGFTVDGVTFTVGTDPTGFFSTYFLKIKLPVSVTQLLDVSVRPAIDAALWGPVEKLARPALSGAGELYLILTKGAGRDDELGDIRNGLNLYAKLRLSEIEPLATIHRLVPGLGLADKFEVLHLALYRQPLKGLLVELLSQLEVPLGDSGLVLSEVSLAGSANLQTSTTALAVNCRFKLRVGQETLILRGNIQVDSRSVVTLWGALDAADGKWENAFGVRSLSIGGFGVQMAILPGPMVGGFGARGDVHFGNKLLGGTFAILRDPTQPVSVKPGDIADGDKSPPPANTEPVMVPAEVTLVDSPEGINLPALLAAFAPEEVASHPLVKNILNVAVTDLNFYRSNGALTIAGQYFTKGWSFRGRLNLWGYRALVEGRKTATGFYLHGTFDPIRIQAAGQDFFALTSADGKSGPFVYIDATLEKQGLALSGQLTLLGGPSVGTEVTIDERGFSLTLTTAMGGLYGGATLSFDGQTVRIAQKVTFPYSLVVSGATVTLSVSAQLSIEASLQQFKQTVAFSFEALGQTRQMKLVETVVPFPGLSDVSAAFVQFFEKDVKGIFGLLSWVPHTDAPLIPHLDGPMIPHADAPIIPHGDVSFVPHTDAPVIPHGDVSFVPHFDTAASGHADAAEVIHIDFAESAHIDSYGYTHGDSTFIGIHSDWTDHPHGDSGIPHGDSPGLGHADGYAVPHVDSPSTAHVDTAQVLHADSPSTAHVDTAEVLHADTPAVVHADSPEIGHMDDPGHWGS